MCTKGIHSQVLINTLDPYPQLTLDQYSIDMSVDNQLTSWLINTCESVDTQRYINRLAIKMLIECQPSVDQMSVKMLIKC